MADSGVCVSDDSGETRQYENQAIYHSDSAFRP